jgi:hypothetical protein
MKTSRVTDEDASPDEPGEGWQDDTDAPQPAPPRRRSQSLIYAAVALLLVIVTGGGVAAYVGNWIDIGGMLPHGGGGRAAGGDAGQVVFTGNTPPLAARPGNLVQQDRSDPSITWIRSSLRQADASGATDAVSLQVNPSLAADLVGRRIRVSISARAPDDATPAPFAVAYSSADAGSSGWVVFTPTREFADYSFDFQVPDKVGTGQYVGIWSDISGRNAALAVRSISIRRLE